MLLLNLYNIIQFTNLKENERLLFLAGIKTCGLMLKASFSSDYSSHGTILLVTVGGGWAWRRFNIALFEEKARWKIRSPKAAFVCQAGGHIY